MVLKTIIKQHASRGLYVYITIKEAKIHKLKEKDVVEIKKVK